MMSLSVKQPWAEFIVGGIKPIANQNGRSAYKGVLLIYASKTFDDRWREHFDSSKCLAYAREYLNRRTIGSMGRLRFPKGAIIGAVIMTGCDKVEDDLWCEYGSWYFRFRDAYRLKKPIKCKGWRGVFMAPLPEDSEPWGLSDLAGMQRLESLAAEAGYKKI